MFLNLRSFCLDRQNKVGRFSWLARARITEEQIKILDPARITEPVRPLDAAKQREKPKAK